MGFSSAKRALITALAAGAFRHEIRDVLSEKNLLAIGELGVDEVIRIVRQARGEDYSVSPHHWDPETAVHVFRPTVDGTRWYVKAYFVDDEDGGAVFVSIHR